MLDGTCLVMSSSIRHFEENIKSEDSVHVEVSQTISAGWESYVGLFLRVSFCMWVICMWMLNNNLPTWPSGKLPFDCQKIAKNLTFFQKKLPKIFIFFKKIANGNFFFFNENFWQFFWKKCKIFGNFLTFKWQFSGGSGG